MNKGFVLALMIFCHVIDDYRLQGILAAMKQKEWWKQNAPDEMYKNDWLMALAMHSFSWSFMIMLPIAILNGFAPDFGYFVFLLFNMALHMIVDDMKANRRIYNLVQDQSIHIVQIIITWAVLCA